MASGVGCQGDQQSVHMSAGVPLPTCHTRPKKAPIDEDVVNVTRVRVDGTAFRIQKGKPRISRSSTALSGDSRYVSVLSAWSNDVFNNY